MDEQTVRLTGYAYGGEALGRLQDGRMVFVPFALPGETVRIRLVEEKRGYARAQLLEVLAGCPGAHPAALRALWRLRRLPLPAAALPASSWRQSRPSCATSLSASAGCDPSAG